MEAPAVASSTHRGAHGGGISVLETAGAAVLAGLGLLGTFYWLITLRWLLFVSVVPLIVGAYLLFTRATGADHA